MFKGARYMDDILLVLSRSRGGNTEDFLQRFTESECYWPPLKLEEGAEGVFLETRYATDGATEWSYRLKNENEERLKVWRYHHYHSALPYQMKRACLMATLRKVHKMASDRGELFTSAQAKLNEFAELQYPCGIRKFMCAIMARDYSSTVWRHVRSLQA